MKVIVCGAGLVGTTIARQLAAEGNEITMIDVSPERAQKAAESYDLRGIVGHASHPDVLERAGAADTDMLIAVTFADEVNMVACEVAHALFNVPTKIARIRAQSYLKPEWSDLFNEKHISIDYIISPEIEVARAIHRRILTPGAFEMIPFAADRLRLIGVRLADECPVLNTPLRQLTELFPDLSVNVCGIVRDGNLTVPGADDHLEAGDEIYFVALTDHVQRGMRLFGHEEREARRVVIAGGGNIGLFLAKEIEAAQSSVILKIIEANKERAEYVAGQIRSGVVLNGDTLDMDILSEAKVGASEAILALTNDDEVNILTSLLAKRAGCQRAITLVNNPAYENLIGSLGVDVVVNPRSTTVSSILQHVRRGRIRGVYSLRDGAAEVIEAEAVETSALVGQPLRDLDLPSGMMIGAVIRGGDVMIARAETEIEAGDRVILFARTDAVKKVEKLFAVRLEFF
ncbi:MAG TPA: Trk system potassium transporter TrkA [Ferrovibrio sp.]|jgi:trk system potassium uptake protein TrkA|uniref:Trk system potassium transporter TrkA n=1 Tax=Ferrovibrio sp. TaxID=1917215 RepID=UPI002B4B8C4A|nr:Trk system potassium transporter TrkA [Ferrovibrio sp.]HLT79276.1 Trk system potassium transporter TrkA [Ferrovibrio sp.]